MFKQILSWLLDLRHCNSTADVASAALCSLSLPQMYNFMLLTFRHANIEKAIYRVRLKPRGPLLLQWRKRRKVLRLPLLQLVLSEDMQTMVRALMQVADILTKMMKTFMPAISHLQHYLQSVEELNLMQDMEFNEVRRLYLN